MLRSIFRIFLALTLTIGMTASADQQAAHGDKNDMSETAMSHKAAMSEKAAMSGKTAMSQKEAISHMHHELHDAQAGYKEKEAQALKELNEMTIRDDVKIEDVNNKIDELMAAKTHIMRLRYAHLIEMRAALTEEQRVGYDKGVLKRSAVE